MADDPGLFCVVIGAAFAGLSTLVVYLDRASALACIVFGAVLVALGLFILWREHHG